MLKIGDIIWIPNNKYRADIKNAAHYQITRIDTQGDNMVEAIIKREYTNNLIPRKIGSTVNLYIESWKLVISRPNHLLTSIFK